MKKNLVIVLALFNFFTAFSQAGKLDKTFGKNGYNILQGGRSAELDYITPLTALQADGKTLILENVSNSEKDSFYLRVSRLDISGKLDKTFNKTGQLLYYLGEELSVKTNIIALKNGKILVSGFDAINSDFQLIFIKINADGTLDNTFGKDGIVLTGSPTIPEAIMAGKELADGNIVFAGITAEKLDKIEATIFKINQTTGKLDNSFGKGGFYTLDKATTTPYKSCFDIEIDANGDFFAAGYGVNDDNKYSAFIFKVQKNGILDETFADKGLLEVFPSDTSELVLFNDIEIQADGKILALKSTRDSTNTFNSDIIRYTKDGKVDATFADKGILMINPNTSSSGNELKIQKNGAIVVNVDEEDGYSNVTYRFNSAGELDKTFNSTGSFILSSDSLNFLGGNILLTKDENVLVSIYTINIIDSISYRTTFRLTNDKLSKVIDINLAEKINVFPNPISNNMTLVYTLSEEQAKINIDIVTVEGKIVTNLVSGISKSAGNHQDSYSVDGLPSGVYFVRIKSDKKVSHVKMIKI